MKCKHVYLLLMLFVGALTFQMKAQKSEVTIKGKIVDSKTQEPIIGASVQIAGTTTGAQSDLDGAFVLKLAPNSKLKISYIGYVTKEITVTKSETVVISLVESAISLNEVVLIGYGKVKKGDLSASVATVSNIGQLKERPIQGVEEMLQGQIPGVTVVSQGGHLDSKPAITIRGMGSRAEEKPLFVVDGVPNAPFNIGDVVSMTVLKDTASAAIYGAYAGSAGVIIVTTKRASEGKPTFQYNMVTGVSKATNLPQSLTIGDCCTRIALLILPISLDIIIFEY
ncbi:carboxypeptidase-like regulatory domain-containing protein [Porphyromonas pogonae]|uniref:carboxypeptidase-like regulatory domain-containing protein n=1 Tax=Porphyromonas pogonae TaxID=867595 RepID=UPI002E75B372|nr:carboxypeptidase-like regulatory domain-containing protein [Porphyromonas pogonae]